LTFGMLFVLDVEFSFILFEDFFFSRRKIFYSMCLDFPMNYWKFSASIIITTY
jgi:hypothetical protein